MPPYDHASEGSFVDRPSWEDPFQLLEQSYGQECDFCDARIPVYNEGFLVARYQILIASREAFLCCEDCWTRAASGAPDTSISVIAGVSTIFQEAS